MHEGPIRIATLRACSIYGAGMDPESFMHAHSGAGISCMNGEQYDHELIYSQVASPFHVR